VIDPLIRAGVEFLSAVDVAVKECSSFPPPLGRKENGPELD
jgi:hypothetical protein